MQIARSLVIKPCSMVLMQTSSSCSQNCLSSVLLSSLAPTWGVYLSSQTKAPRKFQHTVEQSTSPGKDGSNWVGASLLSLLVLSVVTSDSSVCCLSLDGSCWVHQYRGHETERTETLQEIRTCFYNKQHIPEQQYRIGHHHHNSYMPTRNHQVI